MVRQLICLITAVLLAAQAASTAQAPAVSIDRRATVLESSSQRLTVSFDLSGVPTPRPADASQLASSVNQLQFTEFGLGATLEEGKPILPCVSRFVIVPPDRGLELAVTSVSPQPIPVDGVPPFYFPDSSDDDVAAAVSQIDNLYPPQYAEMSSPVVIRGVRLVQLTTYPIQFDPVNNRYLRRDHIEAEVRFTDSPPENPSKRPIRANRSRNFLKYINALALNGAEVGRDDPDQDSEPEFVGHYLVVIRREMVEFAKPFIEWRRQSGYKVDILSVNSQEASGEGTIRDYIQDRYDSYLDAGQDPFDEILLIGDRNNAYGGPPAQCIITAPRGDTEYGGAAHADYFYGDLEGEDEIADVGVSRWPTGIRELLEATVTKTLSYESEPYIDNPEWFNRSVSFSQHDGHSSFYYWRSYTPAIVNWARETVVRAGINDISAYEQNDFDQSGNNLGPWIRDRYNEGQNVVVGIGGNQYWRNDFLGVEPNDVFPIHINVGCHSNSVADVMYRTSTPNDLKGPVAMTAYWGDPSSVVAMNAVWMETVSGMFAHDLSLGWSRMFAVSAVNSYLSGVEPHFKTDYEFYGDPGLQPWLGTPRIVTARYPESISPNAKYIEVTVNRNDNDEPVEGAQVTIYAPGNPPEGPEDYAAYDGFLMMTKRSDADGIARFVVDQEGELQGEVMYTTVTGRDIYPVKGEIEMREPQTSIDLQSYRLLEIEGNGDGVINPRETFALGLTVTNADQDAPIHDVIGRVSSVSPWVTVEDIEVTFGDISAGESATAIEEAVLIFSHTCPDGASRPAQKPSIIVELTSAEYAGHVAFTLEPVSPNYEVVSVVGGSIIGTEQTELDIELSNIGSTRGEAITARIQPLGGRNIQVIREESTFEAIAPGESATLAGDPFVVAGTRFAIPGAKTRMLLTLSSAEGFADSAYFELQVEEPREDAPQGPDAYGYVCYDDRDRDWDSAPVYDWVEICPAVQDAEFEGTRLDFEADELDAGQATVVNLDFLIKFYGEDYDQITVSTNGFISMGPQPGALTYENWPMDRGIGGGVGMIAPFWDDLDLNLEGAGVYYYYDPEHGRIIIEWHDIRYHSAAQRRLNFELVIYDGRVWETDTGDALILFQYRNIENLSNLRDNERFFNPFASVGISSPHGTGVNYTWGNRYPITSAPIENRRAILFATSGYIYHSGVVRGGVYDYETDLPVAGALILTSYGFRTRTNDAGEYILAEAMADHTFNLTTSAHSYLDSTISDCMVNSGDTLEVNFFLLHPELILSENRIATILDSGDARDIDLNLTNSGNGPLIWTSEKCLLGDADTLLWNTRRSFPASETVGDERLQGVTFLDGHIYIAGSNDADPNMIYVLDRDGEMLNSFVQPGNSRFGFRDLESDGELLWGAGEDSIFGFTTSGEVVYRWPCPFNPSACIAWDSNTAILWVSAITSDIIGFDREGNAIIEGLSRCGMRLYGLAYYHDDPDNFRLYILNLPGAGVALIYKMDSETGDTAFVHQLELLSEQNLMTGLSITNEWDIYSWVMMNIDNIPIESGGDRVRIVQLDARKDWFDLDIESGIIPPGGVQHLTLTFDTSNLPDTLFEGELRFECSSTGIATIIGVSLRVLSEQPPNPFLLYSPANGDSISAVHYPADSLVAPPIRFIWHSSDDPNVSDTTINYIYHIRTGNVTRVIPVRDTTLCLKVDTLNLPFWLDRPIIWWVDAFSGHALTECRQRFMLTVSSNEADEERPDLPVEFGFQSVYPSPFNSVATIRFGADRAERTTLSVYDVLGRKQATLFEATPTAGYYSLKWDAGALASGVYILRLESAGRISAAKIALVR